MKKKKRRRQQERRKEKEEKKEEKNKESEMKENMGKLSFPFSSNQYHSIPTMCLSIYHSTPSLPNSILSFSTIIIHIIWENN